MTEDPLLRQPSTHISRDRKGKDDQLEELLIAWGDDRAGNLSGLDIAISTPETTDKPKKKKRKKTQVSLKWNGSQPKQTRCVKPVVPVFWRLRRMSIINNAVWELEARYQEMLIKKYEEKWDCADFCKHRNWIRDTYYKRISEARRAIRNHPSIKELLGRC